MNTIKQTYLINASPAEVWRALTDPEVIEAWSDADAEFEPIVGVEYALWDGSICGEIVEVVPRKKLVQTWQPDNWERTDSVVTFALKSVGKKTRVDLLHENVEGFDYAGTSEGWDAYYLGAIKRMFDTKPAKKVRNTKSTTLRLRSGRTKAVKGKAAAKKASQKSGKKKTARK
jgi:uncharacterized protein YndB with AHSA1/START domain